MTKDRLEITLLTPFLIALSIIATEIAISFNSVLLPNIKQSFLVNESLAQLTVSIGLFALGFSGMIYGGISDSIGRKPIFLVSIFIFTVSNIFCIYAPNITVFILARFIQGVGSGACWIVGNACLKDIYHGESYTKVMNYIHAVAGIIPAVAPTLGSKIAVFWGWKSCFAFLACIGLSIWFGIYFKQKETLKNPKPFSFKSSVFQYRQLFSSVPFCVYLFIKVIAVMLIFVETSNVSLLFIDYFGVDPSDFGYYVFPGFFCYVLSTVAAAYLLKFLSVKKILIFGLAFIFLSQILILSSPLSWQSEPWIIQGFKTLTYLGWGFIFGNATAMIVHQVPDKAASASAVMIGLEMIMSSVGISIMGFFFDGTIIPMTLFMALCSLLCLCVVAVSNRYLIDESNRRLN